jgi:tetratricopeptide (TPR) repeat protein
MRMRGIQVISGVLLATGCGLAGCGGVPASALRQVSEAQTAAAGGRYARAEQLVDPVIRAHGRKRQTATAYYVRGLCRIQSGARAGAREDFDSALRLSQDAELSALVEAQLGNMAFDDGDYSAACLHYEKAAPRLPHSAPSDRVLLQYGIALQRSGRFDEADRKYAQLIESYPNSPHLAAAHAKQAWDGAYFAIQCGAFGQQASAQALAASLHSRGLKSSITAEERGGSRLFMVRVGRFPSYADAARLLARVRAVAPDAYIVP